MEDKQSTASPKLQYRLRHTFTGHTDAVAAVKLSRSGLQVLSCSADKSIRLWDIEEKKEVRVFHGHDRGCSDVVWHPSGQYMASASDDHTLRLWDIESGRTLRTLRSHTHNVMCCHFHPCGNLLASGSFDESVRLWDVRTGEAVKSIPAHSDPVTSVNFNVDGTCLVSSSFDGLIRVWETFSGKCVKTLNCGKGGSEWIPPVSSTIYAPNGLYLLLSTLNGRIRVWDPHKTKPIRFFRGHKNQEYCLNSTWAGSEHVVSGSEDNGIYFWGLQGPTMGGGRKPVYTIPGRLSESDAGDGHCDVVLCVDHTAGACPAGARLVTGSMKRDKSIKLWERCKPEEAAITGS